jgi:SAM-dependent methyltransferase
MVTPALGLTDGRRAFGGDAANYDVARPPYPERVFEVLRERCGLGAGTRTFEVGPGTGLATRRLLEMGAAPLVAIEPDARLAEVLRERSVSEQLQIIEAPFEDAELAAGAFDLGCSATAFHWIVQRSGLAKVADALQPGGAWAMWWNVFGDPEQADPFHEATAELLAPLATNPAQRKGPKQSFALDAAARLEDMRSIGMFEDVACEMLRWTLELTPAQVRALYASYSHIGLLDLPERARILDALHDIAANEFGGRVERKMVTPIYTCRRT